MGGERERNGWSEVRGRDGQMRASKQARPTGMRGGGEGGRRAGAGPYNVSTVPEEGGGGVVADRDGVVPAA